MGQEKINELLKSQSQSSVVEERLRTPMTILFSDIEGSTSYFEREGDVQGLVMVQRHNALLFPCIEENAGRVIKTMGDAIMALFQSPVDALNAAAEMQRALHKDGEGRAATEQIHIRIGVHTGLGLITENDVFGDVVNAAARVESEAQPDEIVITSSLLSAVRTTGMLVGKLGRVRLKGKGRNYRYLWSGLVQIRDSKTDR